MTYQAKLKVALSVAALAVIAGCGGGGGGGDDSAGGTTGPATIPSTATASIDAYVAYVKSLTATSSDTTDPVLLGDATAPVSDTADTTGL